ncbi:MAG: DNA repair ATPase, partial [Myxococcota bacterium]
MAAPRAGEAPTPDEAALEGGSYEVLRRRLGDQARVLSEKSARLNERRQQSFGGAELSIIGTERIRTENNCVPQDMVQVKGRLLLGYNVFVGLRKETRVSDVFSLHRFEQTEDGFDLSALPQEETQEGLLRDESFTRDFEELYRYYSNARLSLLRRNESRLLAVFNVGADEKDIRVFRWALDAKDAASYIDNRGERDHVFPPSHDFEWIPTGREDQVSGRHPHVSILDEVFVEAVGGDLTVKVENNTEDGEGIYREPVDDPSQGLDDGRIEYAKVGRLILIRVLPFREEAWRYLVFNTRTREVVRIDGIGQACVSLPEDQGIIFPGGYYLQTGDYRLIDTDTTGLRFKRAIRSPNGEDVLYVFHRASDGHFLLFPYNLVRQEVAGHINCHGYSLFTDGKMVVFRATSDQPTRVHPVQIWQTPFTSMEHESARPSDGSFLGKVGNAELVRGISDCFTVCRMARAEESGRRVYEDLVSQVQRVLDAYYWMSDEEVEDLSSTLHEIRQTAELIIDEYEKVVALRERAASALADAEERSKALLREIRPDTWERIDDFLTAMSGL